MAHEHPGGAHITKSCPPDAQTEIDVLTVAPSELQRQQADRIEHGVLHIKAEPDAIRKLHEVDAIHILRCQPVQRREGLALRNRIPPEANRHAGIFAIVRQRRYGADVVVQVGDPRQAGAQVRWRHRIGVEENDILIGGKHTQTAVDACRKAMNHTYAGGWILPSRQSSSNSAAMRWSGVASSTAMIRLVT